AADLLVEGERCAPNLGASGDDFEHIVEAAGLQIVDLDAAHDEHQRVSGIRRRKLLVVNAEQPDEVGAAALAEFQEIGVIDNAREIGVLEIDADGQDMCLAFDPPGKVRPVAAHGSSLPLNSGNCAEACDGAGSPRWVKAAAVSMRPRGVRAMKPCCSR